MTIFPSCRSWQSGSVIKASCWHLARPLPRLQITAWSLCLLLSPRLHTFAGSGFVPVFSGIQHTHTHTRLTHPHTLPSPLMHHAFLTHLDKNIPSFERFVSCTCHKFKPWLPSKKCHSHRHMSNNTIRTRTEWWTTSALVQQLVGQQFPFVVTYVREHVEHFLGEPHVSCVHFNECNACFGKRGRLWTITSLTQNKVLKP